MPTRGCRDDGTPLVGKANGMLASVAPPSRSRWSRRPRRRSTRRCSCEPRVGADALAAGPPHRSVRQGQGLERACGEQREHDRGGPRTFACWSSGFSRRGGRVETTDLPRLILQHATLSYAVMTVTPAQATYFGFPGTLSSRSSCSRPLPVRIHRLTQDPAPPAGAGERENRSTGRSRGSGAWSRTASCKGRCSANATRASITR